MNQPRTKNETTKLSILVLEDDLRRVAIFREKLTDYDLVFVDTAADAIGAIRSEDFDVIFLDHDLGGETYVSTADENTGSEVVRHMTQPSYLKTPVVIVHSMNTPAAESMEHALAYEGYEVHRIPFPQLVNYLKDPFFIR